MYTVSTNNFSKYSITILNITDAINGKSAFVQFLAL